MLSVNFALSEISDDVIALRVRRVPRRGGQRHLGVFGQEWEVGVEIETLELGAAEAVDQRVHQAVHVGEDHEAVKDHRGLVLGGRAGLLHPGDQQHHPGEGAGQEADGEDHHDGGHQEDGSPQLGLVAHCLLPEPVDDSRGAVDHDDEGDDDLAEEDRLSQAVHHVLQSEKHTVVSGQVYKLSISMGFVFCGKTEANLGHTSTLQATALLQTISKSRNHSRVAQTHKQLTPAEGPKLERRYHLMSCLSK